MALPENFSEWELLQSTLMRVHNRIVREEFSDLGGEDWSPSISTPRGALRQACTVKDNDTAPMVLNRLFLYYFSLRKAQDLQPPVYGIPIWDAQASRKFKPQIMLYFSQDAADYEEDQKSAVRGQITFRLMNESSTTITKTELSAIATRIKNAFGIGQGYQWHRGRNLATYNDPENGYGLQILTDTKTNAKELIDKVIGLKNNNFEGKYFKYHTNDDDSGAYPANPGSQHILGKTIKKPVNRRITRTRFRYAVAHIHGLNLPIPLCDKTGKFVAPLAE